MCKISKSKFVIKPLEELFQWSNGTHRPTVHSYSLHSKRSYWALVTKSVKWNFDEYLKKFLSHIPRSWCNLLSDGFCCLTSDLYLGHWEFTHPLLSTLVILSLYNNEWVVGVTLGILITVCNGLDSWIGQIDWNGRGKRWDILKQCSC